MKTERIVHGAAVALAVVGAVASAAMSSAAIEPAELGSADTVTEHAVPRCAFTTGDDDAFTFESVVSSDDATAEAASDRFAGVLSWVVERGSEGDEPARLRAALSEVELTQALTPEGARASAAELSGTPFFVEVDGRCRLGALGFSPAFSPASRQLVATLLTSAELVLPEDETSETWEVAQRDGVGDYTGRYTLGRDSGDTVRVVRTKDGYDVDPEVARMGLRIQVLGSIAEARFDAHHPGWMARVALREHVRFDVPGQAPQGLGAVLVIERDASRHHAVAAASRTDADFTDAFASGEVLDRPSDPALATMSHDDALAAFLDRIRDDGSAGVFGAARVLADWMRQHPDGAAMLLTDLRDGVLDPEAHAALFLAFELAGDAPSRVVLLEALGDDALGEVDRARAAAALASHGEPTDAAMQALLAQAHGDTSPLVANVSLLGLGSMTGRAPEDGALRGALRTALSEELAGATSLDAEVAAIDALGNSRDVAFEGALSERFGSERPVVRAHAAAALGHLPRETARPRLLAQLGDEESPRVTTAILRSLHTMDDGATLASSELDLARTLLASDDAEVRGSAIDWLGHSARGPEVRSLLAAHFGEEPSAQLQQRIGSYVSASDLAEVL